jgi:hypothetical protein
MPKGFPPGKIYDVVYRAKDPVVVGTGLAAVRDMMSYLKYDSGAVAHVRYGIGYGVSQTGRFIRHYLYQGFNADERGRTAFDGFFVHTAGAGRGSFNHRFAQPSRDAQPYSTFFYPTDVFPFTSVPTRDPVTRQSAGLRDNMRGTNATKVFYVDGGHEYWGRAASLTQTTPDGKQDVGFLANERRYVISSAQHSSPSGWPLPDSAKIGTSNAYRGDPLDQRLALRALMSSLIDWVTLQKDPPTPMYPTFAQGTLVSAANLQFPKIPEVLVARIPNQPYRMNFGPRWNEGIIDRDTTLARRTCLVSESGFRRHHSAHPQHRDSAPSPPTSGRRKWECRRARTIWRAFAGPSFRCRRRKPIARRAETRGRASRRCTEIRRSSCSASTRGFRR